MARWIDPLSPEQEAVFRSLLNSLRRAKPPGWSVVWRENEISVRPVPRSLGRFSIVFAAEGVSVAFHSRFLGIWNKWARFEPGPSSVPAILEWMRSQVAVPERPVEEPGVGPEPD